MAEEPSTPPPEPERGEGTLARHLATLKRLWERDGSFQGAAPLAEIPSGYDPILDVAPRTPHATKRAKA